MISTVELSAILADLYAVPFQRDGWQVFFDRLSNLTQLSFGCLVCCRPDGRNIVLAGGGANFDSKSVDLYHKHYAATDPGRIELDANPRVGVIRGEELITRSHFLQSELYNDLLSRHDAEYLTVLTSDSSREVYNVFSLWRGRNPGPMNDDSVQQLEMLVPHVRNSIALQTQISDSHSFRLLSEAVMESMSIAALQVTGDCRVKYANRLGARYLRDADGLRQRDGFLFAVDSERHQRLHSLIVRATRDDSDDVLSVPGGALQVQRRKAKTSLHVTVVPAPKEHRLTFLEPSALVFISDPASSIRSRSSILRQLYGLTPTEARLASELLQGLELREVAERMSIAYETARFHLKRLMIKTGTRRQADLIRLVLSLPGQ